MVQLIESEGREPSTPTLPHLKPLPYRCLTLIIDLIIPLLPYETILDVITTHKLVERILKMIFQQSQHALHYSFGMDLVKAVVATGRAHKLINEKYASLNALVAFLCFCLFLFPLLSNYLIFFAHIVFLIDYLFWLYLFLLQVC